MQFNRLFTCMLASTCLLITLNAAAKEINFTIKGQSSYPLNVYYQVQTKNHFYGKGVIKNIKPYQRHRIAVNRIPNQNNVLIKISKMTVASNVASVTEINDPCEILLNKNQLTATLQVGFQGNPNSHGEFNCNVSSNQ